MFPVFEMHKADEEELFSKGHQISNYGAKLTGATLAEYLLKTTEGISSQVRIFHDAYYEYSADEGNPEILKICKDKFYIEDEDGIKTCYWNQYADDSEILIFGDCNLQAYTSCGTGIAQSLAYFLQYPVYDGGRKLIFGHMYDPISKEDLEKFSTYKVVVYVAFASAPYVRTARLLRKQPSFEYKWVNFSMSCLGGTQ